MSGTRIESLRGSESRFKWIPVPRVAYLSPLSPPRPHDEERSLLSPEGLFSIQGPVEAEGYISCELRDVRRLHDRTDRLGTAGAVIPPELFDNILFFVDRDSFAYLDGRKSAISLRRYQGDPDDRDVLHRLKLCSLVSRHWANRCRRYMFTGVTLIISSVEEAEIFRTYVTHGCPSLVQVHRLIGRVSVEQRYDAHRSFCHVLHSLAPLIKDNPELRESTLRLIGPVPDTFPRVFLDGPHWSFAPSTVTPPSLLQSYSYVTLTDIHLPSFAHAIRYARHFKHAQYVRFTNLTWDKDGPLLLFPQMMVRKHCQDELSVFAEGCTSNSRLCVQVAMTHLKIGRIAAACLWRTSLVTFLKSEYTAINVLNPTCQIVQKTDREGQIAVGFEAGNYKLSTYCELVVNLESSPSAANPNPTPINMNTHHILAFRVILRMGNHHLNLDGLLSHIRLHNHLLPQIVVVNFDSYSELQTYMQRFRPIALNPHPGTSSDLKLYLLTCGRSRNHPFHEVSKAGDWDVVGINPITLSPTGQSWERDWKIVSALLS
ncbi:hypothetical protein BDY19DRAFT_1055499 [Irpex rosettiformis]|uniref:Uncharacterized protein n=1 Tax=Irpex rosettiformis TaxID=378272 RepID=A0ACB8U944_9APHY|nr:hypothetical protein BDY19DRAFT_1055499 [Irpex rosettiformis]